MYSGILKGWTSLGAEPHIQKFVQHMHWKGHDTTRNIFNCMAISFQLSQQNAILTRIAYRGKLNAFEENVTASTILDLGMEKLNVKVSFIHLFTTNLGQKCVAHCHFSTPGKKKTFFSSWLVFFSRAHPSCKRIAISALVVKRVQPVSLLVEFASPKFATKSNTFCKPLKTFPWSLYKKIF